MEIQGKVIAILEPNRFVSSKNGNEYVTTVFVIETPGQYPKRVAMKVMGEDRFKQMGIVMGGTYNVSFDVESRLWQGKWFTEASAWKSVRMDGQQQQANTSQAQAPASPAQANTSGAQGDDGDNLPF